MASESDNPDFDPYYKWLGIPTAEQPCNHYRLLGLILFESDVEVIASAADRQMAHIRSFQAGRYSAEAHKLLNEIAAARLCLLDSARKEHYDRGLRQAAAAVVASDQAGGSGIINPPPSPITPLSDQSSGFSHQSNGDPGSGSEARVVIRPPNRQRRPRNSPFKRFVGIVFFCITALGIALIAYTIFLNQDRLLSSGKPSRLADSSPQGEPSRTQWPQQRVVADAVPEHPPQDVPRVRQQRIPPRRPPQSQTRGIPSRPEQLGGFPNRQNDRRQSIAIQPRQFGMNIPAAGGLGGRRPAPERQDELEIQLVALPAGQEKAAPVNLLEFFDVDGDKLEVELYSCRLQRTRPALSIIQAPDKVGRWTIHAADDSQSVIGHLGYVDDSLKFLWGDGASEELRTAMQWSYLVVSKGDKGRSLLRFTAPSTVETTEIDLKEPKTVVSVKSPVIYPEEDLRLDLVAIHGIVFDQDDRTDFYRIKEGDTVTARLNLFPHILFDCELHASGKNLRAELSFRYETPDGRDYGLTARNVELKVAQLERTLAQTQAAKKALPGLENRLRLLRRSASADVTNTYARPQIAQTERQIATANSLIASEAAAIEALSFMKKLVTIGEDIHQKASVACRFYLEKDSYEIDLTAPAPAF